ncbi:hypothetical protein K493DRAFT_379191 [Basidiobolus meristosporus CBS 931.73]|uniref:Uncharacterized protein n=1 Tax=Basidiobolus meristosporus CBS 931.73 TaxID=1314790 RepID=A0A1Y1XZT9_9FUNG|nr:hypothetical protein K493DRAFT_379191 [Basidiobolus meristosporus CBS 931.73]|eukprot:ORX91228.1 hypothetical protein K493DRAFT_379191 [Basidiobolus meristosporus CBS 931.73]
MLFQKPYNSSLNNPQNPAIPVSPLFPCLTKSLLDCKAILQAKPSKLPQSCMLAPVLSRFWRSLFPQGITYLQRLHAEPYSTVTKSGYIHNVVESTGLAALGHGPFGFSTQRFYQSTSASSTQSRNLHPSNSTSYDLELFAHNRESHEIPWEDFQLYDSDSDSGSEAKSENAVIIPMVAPLNEVYQARQSNEEKWEQYICKHEAGADLND